MSREDPVYAAGMSATRAPSDRWLVKGPNAGPSRSIPPHARMRTIEPEPELEPELAPEPEADRPRWALVTTSVLPQRRVVFSAGARFLVLTRVRIKRDE